MCSITSPNTNLLKKQVFKISTSSDLNAINNLCSFVRYHISGGFKSKCTKKTSFFKLSSFSRFNRLTIYAFSVLCFECAHFFTQRFSFCCEFCYVSCKSGIESQCGHYWTLRGGSRTNGGYNKYSHVACGFYVEGINPHYLTYRDPVPLKKLELGQFFKTVNFL